MSEEFDHYIDEVYKVPSLPDKKQETLIKRIREGDEAAKKTLAESYLKVVVDIAKKYDHFKFEDLAIEMLVRGNDTLVEAIDSYHHDLEMTFYDYVEQQVRSVIFDYCKDIFVDFHYDWDKIRESLAFRNECEQARQDLFLEFGREPTAEEIADVLCVDFQKVSMLINDMQTEIKTKRLLLRAIRRNDAQDIYDNWASDPEVTKYLTWSAHESVEVTKAIVELWLEDYRNPNTYRYGIELTGYDHLIGMIDIVGYIDGCPVIGYVLRKDFWNKGYMTEAFSAVIQDLFSKGYEKILIEADVRNHGSNRVIQKCGFTFSHIETKECSDSKPEIVTVNWYFREKS